MAIPKDFRRVTFYCHEDIANEIDRLADRVGVSTSKMASNLAQIGLDDALTLEKIGLISVLRSYRKMKLKLRGMNTLYESQEG